MVSILISANEVSIISVSLSTATLSLNTVSSTVKPYLFILVKII